jgi:hypothetical protein
MWLVPNIIMRTESVHSFRIKQMAVEIELGILDQESKKNNGTYPT